MTGKRFNILALSGGATLWSSFGVPGVNGDSHSGRGICRLSTSSHHEGNIGRDGHSYIVLWIRTVLGVAETENIVSRDQQ